MKGNGTGRHQPREPEPRSRSRSGPAYRAILLVLWRDPNIGVYFAIAVEAQAEAERLDNLARTPKPDGEPGFIVAYDPEQKSFKNSLIAIAGMYLESLFYIEGTKRYGKKKYNNKYDCKSYEDKLQLFGLTDQVLLAEAQYFRKMRRDLIYEKAVELSDLTADTMHFAQEDAKRAVLFVKQVAQRLTQGNAAPAP